jgi:hypothetical protein
MSASRHAASPSHTQPLPTGPRCRPVPPVSRCAHVAHAATSPIRCAPAAVRVARSHRTRVVPAHTAPPPGPSLFAPSPAPTWHRAGPRPPPLCPFAPPRGTAPRGPHLSPASSRLRSKESRPMPVLSSLFLYLSLLRPRPSEPASRPCRRPSHHGPPRRVSDRRLAVVLQPRTLPSANHHRATDERSTARGDHAAACPARTQHAGRHHWPGRPEPSGRPQVAGHRAGTVAVGRFRPTIVQRF